MSGAVDLEFSQFKFLNHFDRVRALAQGEDPARVPPVTVEIDPTNVCNSDCWWCSCAIQRRTDSSALDLDLVRRLLDEVATYGAKSVVFKGGGDPTTVSWLSEAVRRAGSWGLGIGMNTNGVKLNPALRQAMLRCGTWIRFSVDAASEWAYQQTHGTKHFNQVLENIRCLVEERTDAASPLTVGINNNLDEYNVHEVRNMIYLGEELGVDYVSIRPVCWKIAPSTAQEASSREGASLENGIHEAWEASREPGRVAKVIVGNIRNVEGPDTADPGRCLAPALTAIVTASGEVAACCDLRGVARYSFGNIRTSSFSEIWEGDERRAAMALTCERECDSFCSHAYGYYNQIIEYLGSEANQREFL